MKRFALLLTASAILFASVAATAATTAPATPRYQSIGDFLSSTPTVEGSPGGMFNPAVFGISKHGGAGFYWMDTPDDSYLDRIWSMVVDGGGLGFTMQNREYWSTSEWKDFTDYQIGLGFGDRETRFGFSYGWSKGDILTSNPRENNITLGFLQRPNRYLSYGVAVNEALTSKDLRSVVDVGVRPLGAPWLTLFGDATMLSNDKFEDVEWGAGASFEWIPGIALNFKAQNGGVYQAGLAVKLAGVSFSATPHFDRDGNEAYRTYGLRLEKPADNDPIYKVAPLLPEKSRATNYARLDFDSNIRYQRYEFFDDRGHTLMDLLEQIEMVKNDPWTGGLAMRITEDFTGSYELIWEAREKLKELQASGKKVVAYFERGGMQGYYLASVADKIMVDPETMVMLPGFSFGRSYYKGTLEKLGIGFDEWRFFKYKSAMEAFSRTSMSDGDREQRLALATGFYDVFRKDICESRKLTTEAFDNLIDNVVVFPADSLIQYKLADTTGRWDAFEEYVTSVAGSKKKLISAAKLEMWQPESREWGEPPQIAVIYALGPCSMNDGINARKLEKVIKKARDDKKVKAVVLRADSPGGDILPSDIVAGELKKTAEKKPVIITQGQVAASGGYWISMYGDKIVASPWTITGSIGVIGGWFYNNGFNDKLGMTYDHVKVGKHADLGAGAALPLLGMGIPDRNLTPEERDRMEKQIRLWYDVFVGKVASGRKLEKEKVAEIAQGRVWTGTTGKEIGLVDELGGLEKAIAMAREAANIRPDAEVNIREMPKLGPFNPMMFQPKLFGIRLGVFGDGASQTNPELDYLQAILRAEGKPVAMIPPEYLPRDK